MISICGLYSYDKHQHEVTILWSSCCVASADFDLCSWTTLSIREYSVIENLNCFHHKIQEAPFEMLIFTPFSSHCSVEIPGFILSIDV